MEEVKKIEKLIPILTPIPKPTLSPILRVAEPSYWSQPENRQKFVALVMNIIAFISFRLGEEENEGESN